MDFVWFYDKLIENEELLAAMMIETRGMQLRPRNKINLTGVQGAERSSSFTIWR
jgi:hypothetical protein